MPGCHGDRTLRFCIDGRTFNRQCASDERCQGDVCVWQPPPDAGSTCAPGCIASTTVRRCLAGGPVDVPCGLNQVCTSGDCVTVDSGVAPPVDAGPCVDTCVDETTLRACLGGGQVMMVTCNADSPCKAGRCVPPDEPASTDGCSCAGLSTLSGTLLAGMVVRRRRRR